MINNYHLTNVTETSAPPRISTQPVESIGVYT